MTGALILNNWDKQQLCRTTIGRQFTLQQQLHKLKHFSNHWLAQCTLVIDIVIDFDIVIDIDIIIDIDIGIKEMQEKHD